MKKISKKTKQLSLIFGVLASIILILIINVHNFESFEKYISLIFFINVATGIFFLYLYFYIYQNVYHGAYGVTSSNENIKTTINFLLEIKPKKIIDLGSGTGKLCVETTKAGFIIDGVEINPFYYYFSKISLLINGLKNKINIKQKNFWKISVSDYDCVIVYGISFIMDELENKLQNELKNDAYVISIYFKFKKLNLIKNIGEVYLYKM